MRKCAAGTKTVKQSIRRTHDPVHRYWRWRRTLTKACIWMASLFTATNKSPEVRIFIKHDERSGGISGSCQRIVNFVACDATVWRDSFKGQSPHRGFSNTTQPGHSPNKWAHLFLVRKLEKRSWRLSDNPNWSRLSNIDYVKKSQTDGTQLRCRWWNCVSERGRESKERGWHSTSSGCCTKYTIRKTICR